jgi:hypothetical protein
MSRLAVAMGAAVHPDDTDRMRALLDHSLATGEPYSIKYRHRLTDSVFRWMHGAQSRCAIKLERFCIGKRLPSTSQPGPSP